MIHEQKQRMLEISKHDSSSFIRLLNTQIGIKSGLLGKPVNDNTSLVTVREVIDFILYGDKPNE